MNVGKYDTYNQLGMYAFVEGTDRHSEGSTWYVDSNSGDKANSTGSGQGESWDLPFSTINYAVSQCTNQGKDVIFVAANHAETIQDTSPLNASGTVTDELCIDKSEVVIIGMGVGTSRPTITLSGATDAVVEIRAANVTIKNFIIVSGLADVAAGISVANSVDGTIIENVEFRDGGAANLELVLGVTLSANADDVTIRGCQFYNTNAGDNNAAIFTTGATARLKVHDNFFRGDWDNAVMDFDAAASTDTLVSDNIIFQFDATVGGAILLNASTTGAVIDNTIHCPVGSSTSPVIATGALVARNYYTVAEGQSATVLALSSNASVGGNHWYVDSGSGTTTGDAKSWDTALTLVDDAIAKCTASNGDIIHVAAGHAEADMDGTPGQIFDVDVNGISIIGEGIGDSRPTFTFTTDATNANCYITGTDVLLKNLIFKCNIASQDHIIDVAADDVTIEDCEFLEGGQTPLSCITADNTDGDSDNLVIKNCRFYLPTAGNQDNAIEIGKDHAGVRIIDNYIMGDFDEAAIEIPAGGNNCQDMVITGNTVINEQTGIHCIEVDVAALTVTGVCARNTLINDTRSAALQSNILSCYDNVWIPLGGNVAPVKLEAQGVTPGNHVYVDSALGVDDTAHGTTWNEPVATLDYAIALCAASNGDVIHVAPGHAETLTTASYITIDVVGITVIGYGRGTDRPTFTFDTGTDTTWVISAANFHIENCIFVNTQDGLVVGFVCTAAYTTFKNCVFRDAGADNTVDWITVSTNADYFLMDGCVVEGTDTAGNTSFIDITTAAYPTIKNTQINGDYSDGCITFTGSASTDILIDNCRMENKNAVIDSCIQGIANLTGWVSNCYFYITGDTETTWFETPGDTGTFECYGVNNVGEAGKFVGTVSV
jgi:hypothetical protein